LFSNSKSTQRCIHVLPHNLMIGISVPYSR